MPEEVGTDTRRSDAPGADDSPFADATDDKPVAAVEEEDAKDGAADDPQSPGNAGEQKADNEDAQGPQSSGDAEAQAAPPEELKVVVSIKGGRASIGVQQPSSSDPHIETFGDPDLSGLAQEVPAVVERARARWEDNPKHPAYERPAAPARSRNRRGQGSAQDATAEAEGEQAQQQTLKLF